MSPEAERDVESVFKEALLSESERRQAEQMEGLQKEVVNLRGLVEGHADERRRDWTQVNRWALAANIALFSIAIVVAIGVTGHNVYLGSEMRSKGERLAIVEERLRAFTELPP